MIGDITVADDIYIVCGYTDMRKSIDGLCAIVEDKLHMDPRSRAIFLFCGRRADRLKILMWEQDGFVLLYKRLREDIVGQEIRTKSEVFHGVSLTGFFQASILSSLRLSEPLNNSSSAFVHFS